MTQWAAFTRQFTPVEGGYVFYPSPKSGGKLVTEPEYQILIADWQRLARSSGRWKMAGIVMLAILVWTLASDALELPDWADGILTAVGVLAVSGWVWRLGMAPHRLVKGRTDIAPPRLRTEARREARRTLRWQMIVLMLLLSGGAFLNTLMSSERTWEWWAWIIGSGLFFGLYLWIAFEKVRDRKR